MNKLLPNLLIFFALALCALCAVQWVREARLRKKIDGLNQMVYERDQTIQGLQGSLKRAEAEIVRLDTRNNELKATEKTNTLEIASLKRSLRKAENENETLTSQIEEYKKAVEQQNEAIKKQNEEVKEQNALFKKIVEERNEYVQ